MVPKVSVIIPVYNCEKYISECLESVLNQTYTNIDIIIVNDGSTDRSEEIVNEYKEKDNRIVYYSQENSGPSEARNKGILNSTGEYLVFVDSDDTINKYYIELLIKQMISTGSDLVCCGYKDISEYGVLNYTDFNFDNNVSVHAFMDMVCSGTGGVLWSKLYKKEIIINNGLRMDKNIFMCEDLIFILQYVSHCTSFSAIKEYLYNYNRLNQSSISSNISINYIQNYIKVFREMENVFNSVYLNEYKKRKIITKEIQDIVVKLVEQQSINIKVTGRRNAICNIKKILSIPYVNEHKDAFSSDDYFYKPYIFLIRNNFVRTSIMYGVCLNILRNLKKKLKKRK
ncbi:glycosyltransferase family 2 protein [Bacillus sp. FJAT-53711]|uniref:Glycosyltransferase family 2 protein n=1 Tax=Bacillus yunxiaonensis TaxID=3127665 RepID=A0ABU8FSC2_9BACI